MFQECEWIDIAKQSKRHVQQRAQGDSDCIYRTRAMTVASSPVVAPGEKNLAVDLIKSKEGMERIRRVSKRS